MKAKCAKVLLIENLLNKRSVIVVSSDFWLQDAFSI